MYFSFFPRLTPKERRSRSKLPRALRGLMGEANIRYARGEKDDAILMCMEIIRQGAPGPNLERSAAGNSDDG